MATYLELHGLRSDSDLQDKVAVACVKKAQTLLDKTSPTTDEVSWADAALNDPRKTGLKILNYVLAKNSNAEVPAITGADDATIQSNVDNAVDALITGGVV